MVHYDTKYKNIEEAGEKVDGLMVLAIIAEVSCFKLIGNQINYWI